MICFVSNAFSVEVMMNDRKGYSRKIVGVWIAGVSKQ